MTEPGKTQRRQLRRWFRWLRALAFSYVLLAALFASRAENRTMPVDQPTAMGYVEAMDQAQPVFDEHEAFAAAKTRWEYFRSGDRSVNRRIVGRQVAYSIICLGLESKGSKEVRDLLSGIKNSKMAQDEIVSEIYWPDEIRYFARQKLYEAQMIPIARNTWVKGLSGIGLSGKIPEHRALEAYALHALALIQSRHGKTAP